MKSPCAAALVLAVSLHAAPAAAATATVHPRFDVLTMQADRQRTGWFSHEGRLTPGALKSGRFGKVWESPPLDGFGKYPARLYASPLYVDGLTLGGGEHEGRNFRVVVAATSSGFVYAINAAPAHGVGPGTILWKTQLVTPCVLPWDASTMGILGTPIIDKARKTLYVSACDAKAGFRVYGLDLATGAVRDGWPVSIDESVLSQPSVDRNPRRTPQVARAPNTWRLYIQRGALNLSPDDRYLYIGMGQARGWVIAVDTARKSVASSFSATPLEEDSVGGVWASTGVSVDAKGDIYAVTGASSLQKEAPAPNNWSQSVLLFAPLTPAGFNLRAVYTPFDYCRTGAADIDLGSSGALIIPAGRRPPAEPLLAVGGKQGNAYLLGGASFARPGSERRPCSQDPETDASLLSPDVQPALAKRGPINLFGPYSETDGMLDRAKSRSTPAYFRDAAGGEWLFYSGSNKDPADTNISVAPGLVSLRLLRPAGRAPYLQVEQRAMDFVLQNPGSPIVTSNGGRDGVVWVFDENAQRSASLTGDDAPKPVLYAVDAKTLKLIWKTDPGELQASGKYNSPIAADGRIYVGTDRIVAFGLK